MHPESQPPVERVSPDPQVSPEREVRKETQAPRVSLCQDHREYQVYPVHRESKDLQDYQGIPRDRTAYPENQDVPVCRDRGATLERQARRVKRATPV